MDNSEILARALASSNKSLTGGHGWLDEIIDEARADERARIIAYLRRQGERDVAIPDNHILYNRGSALLNAADSIEEGEY